MDSSGGAALDLQEARDSGLRGAISRATDCLLSLQHGEGYWRGELTADTTLESDFILLELWMDPPLGGDWNPTRRERIRRAADSILARQLPDGGFNTYAQGPSDLNATVRAYCALKLAGLGADDPRMARARERILAFGGIRAANTYVKINLSLFGLYPRDQIPSIPPELILLGNFVYQMSAWTRAIVIPLSIVHAANPSRPVPEGFTLDELFVHDESTPRGSGWRRVFLWVDRAFKTWEKAVPGAIRKLAVRRAEQWMIERLAGSDGLGAIYPPMMYSIMALDVLGYAPAHPLRMDAVRHFEDLLTDNSSAFYFEPCFSPVWDTAIGGYALGEAGAVPEPALRRAADWLVDREIRTKGDWSVKRPRVEPSGWAFEFRNPFYPDIDDTAMVLLSFRHLRATNRVAQRECERRATQWLLAMQSGDGGWAAFDADNNWEFLRHLPFADHNAMLDPTCPDITGRVLEALAAQGLDRSHEAVERGVRFLVRTQCADGSWYGRWGVAYLYGTCFALRGLRAVGEDDHEVHMLRATEWLRSIQNADGGWGESCASYDRGFFSPAPSTASQTAWAVLGLLAGGDASSESVRKGVEFLVRTQQPDGSWHEDLSTGTGFPRVFYLTYHFYRLYFPLLALAEYHRIAGAARADRL